MIESIKTYSALLDIDGFDSSEAFDLEIQKDTKLITYLNGLIFAFQKQLQRIHDRYAYDYLEKGSLLEEMAFSTVELDIDE